MLYCPLPASVRAVRSSLSLTLTCVQRSSWEAACKRQLQLTRAPHHSRQAMHLPSSCQLALEPCMCRRGLVAEKEGMWPRAPQAFTGLLTCIHPCVVPGSFVTRDGARTTTARAQIPICLCACSPCSAFALVTLLLCGTWVLCLALRPAQCQHACLVPAERGPCIPHKQRDRDASAQHGCMAMHAHGAHHSCALAFDMRTAWLTP